MRTVARLAVTTNAAELRVQLSVHYVPARESRPLFVQSQNFVISRLRRSCSAGVGRIGDKRERWPVHGLVHDHGNRRADRLSRLLLMEQRLSDSVQSPLLSTEHAFHNIRQVLEDLKAISRLHGRRSTTSDSFGVGPSPVTGDELDR